MAHNYFLTATNAGKMDLLNQLSFHNESPTDFVDKIDNELIKQKSILQVKAELLQQQVKEFEQYNSDDMNNILTDDVIKIKTNELM